MKRTMFIIGLLLVLSVGAYSKPAPAHIPGGYADFSINFGVFYSSLSPYGEWFNCDFGYAWRPFHVGRGWRPYLHGRWIWTDYGWYWVSNEPFGWATFHYGRWYYDDYYGWIWIPDNEWGPAWVDWCYNDDYIGWAPMSPYVHFDLNIGITFVNNWYTPAHYWNFIPSRHFYGRRIDNYVQPLDRNGGILRNTHRGGSIRNTDHRIVNYGVDRSIVERETNTRITRMDVVERERSSNFSDRIIQDRGAERIEMVRPRAADIERGRNVRPTDLPRMELKRDMNNRGTVETRKTEPNRAIQNPVQRGEQNRPNTAPNVSPGRRVEQNRTNPAPNVSRERRVEPSRPSALPDRERSRIEMQQRQEEQRSQMQRRQDEIRSQMEQRNQERSRNQQLQENRKRETPQFSRPNQQPREWRQPQVRERPQPSPKKEQPRGGQERRRRP